MLFGAIFGCLTPVLTIAAVMNYKSPFTVRGLTKTSRRSRNTMDMICHPADDYKRASHLMQLLH